MKVKIYPKKKEIHITASGSDKKILTLIGSFAGEAVKNINKSKLQKLTSMFLDKIIIDMSNKVITKEFIQLILRMK